MQYGPFNSPADFFIYRASSRLRCHANTSLDYLPFAQCEKVDMLVVSVRLDKIALFIETRHFFECSTRANWRLCVFREKYIFFSVILCLNLRVKKQ